MVIYCGKEQTHLNEWMKRTHTHTQLTINHLLQDLNGEVHDEDVPPDVLKYRVGWSCPGATLPPPGSPSPVPRAEKAGQCRCPGHTHPCPHWSARSHRHPLQDKTVATLRWLNSHFAFNTGNYCYLIFLTESWLPNICMCFAFDLVPIKGKLSV